MNEFRKGAGVAVVALLIWSGGARAQVVGDGGTNTLDGVTNLVTGSVTVGTNGSFTWLTLTNAALLTNTLEGEIGLNAGANSNAVWLTGPGTRWLLGLDASNTGLYVGNAGAFNTLVISNGATAANQGQGIIGNASTAGNNLALITGVGSVWSNAGPLAIGNSGAGNQLVVSNGGVMSDTSSVLGVLSGANSNLALVTGAGSRWSNSTSLVVGGAGAFNQLVVRDGGVVINDFTGVLGNSAGGNSNLAVVSGAGSQWTCRYSLNIGQLGSFNLLIVSNGGAVASAYGLLGVANNSSHNGVLVTGAGSFWSSGSALDVGSSGSFNQLVVSDGGSVIDNYSTIGNAAQSSNNFVLITGTGSWWSGGITLVGGSGSSNLLVVSNGGLARATSGTVGHGASSSNNAVLVTGAGSVWSNSSSLTIGASGSLNLLVVSDGGVLRDTTGTLGVNARANSNVAVVSGVGSLWKSSSSLVIGGAGSFNQLIVSNGGVVFNTSGILGNSAGGDSNRVVISGAGSLWRSSSLTIGHQGAFNQLVVSNGGMVGNVSATVGYLPGADQNFVFVTDANSFWTNAGEFIIGKSASLNRLVISNGASVVNSGVTYVGYDSFVTNNSVLVTSPNSRWSNYSSLAIGAYGSFNQMIVSNGGVTADAIGHIGSEAGSSKNLVVVTGLGSQWSNSSQLIIGNQGVSNQLFVQNGAMVIDEVGVIGNAVGADNNYVSVSGLGSLWKNSGAITVGRTGSFNQLVISNGGTVTTAGVSEVGASTGADNNAVIVTGSGSALINATNFFVGSSGASSRLIVADGGFVSNIDAMVGSNSAYNTAVVTGPGSLWQNSGVLTVGINRNFNALMVSNGGTVTAASLRAGAFIGTTSTPVRNDGGFIVVTNGSGTGLLDFRRGRFLLNGGVIEADALALTDSFGYLEFNGGRLITRGTTNANGLPFTVGNGTSNATFQLIGGAHVFSNGLVLATNSLLKGTGTIVGAVTNFGTIAPGSSPTALTINGSLSLRDSANLSFEIGGLLATNQYDVLTVTNFVELAGTLSLSLLNGFYPAAGDSFTVFKFGSATGAFGNVSGGGRLNTVDNLGSFLVTLSATNVVVGGYVSPDSDGDGQSDYAESLAGTSPTNSASVLALVPLAVSPAGALTLRFPFVAGRSYRILWTDNLAGGVSNVIAAPGFVQNLTGFYDWVDDGTQTGGLAATTRVYRVGLQ